MRRSIWSTGVYLLLVFVSGAVVGAFAHRLYTLSTVQATRDASRNSQEYRKRYIDDMKARLKLSGEQVGQLSTILDETRTRYRELHERFRPEMTAIQEEQTGRIRGMLTPEQQESYEKMRKERDLRRKREGGKYSY